MDPPTKKAKTWVPPSVESIANKDAFESTTYHSEIPRAVKDAPDASVILGVDEAGRGPVLGPMVYGISYCLEDYHDTLKKQYGFADSKTLKDDRRQELFQIIENTADDLHSQVGWATTTMTAKDISRGMLQLALGKGSYNLNEQAHDTTIELIKQVISKGVNIRKIYVDTVGPPATYQAKLSRVFPNAEVTVTKKADSIYPIVSTASVVAKVTRDLNLEYFRHHVLGGDVIGSGYPSDPNTSRWLTSNVDPVFGWHYGLTRFSWQTAKDALEKHGGVGVLYEAQCFKEPGYEDIGAMFQPKAPAVSANYYGAEARL